MFSRFFSFVLPLLLLQGCLNTRNPGGSIAEDLEAPVKTEPVSKRTAKPATPAKMPVLRAGYYVAVDVFVNGQAEIEVPEQRVTSSGKVALPLIGNMVVQGLDVRTMEWGLAKEYSRYLKDPKVVVRLSDSGLSSSSVPWGAVTVLGRVSSPGRIAIPPTQDLTVSAAIQEAGGFESSADRKSISVTRKSDEDEIKIKVNLKSVDRELDNQDLILKDGDVIFVPETIF